MPIKNIYIWDFNDSFTFNLVAEYRTLYPKAKIQVIALEAHEQVFLELRSKIFFQAQSAPYEVIVLLGPGPGHPRDYLGNCAFYHQWFNFFCGLPVQMKGICLGHQIILHLLGESVRPFPPSHGLSLNFSIPFLPRGLKVMRYNSLGVFGQLTMARRIFPSLKWLSNQHGQVMVTHLAGAGGKASLLTYQFHPESVGTNFPSELLAFSGQ